MGGTPMPHRASTKAVPDFGPQSYEWVHRDSLAMRTKFRHYFAQRMKTRGNPLFSDVDPREGLVIVSQKVGTAAGSMQRPMNHHANGLPAEDKTGLLFRGRPS